MKYIENPKTKGSGIICAIPQTGRCPNNCEDCFFQSGRSFLEPLEKNLPNIPSYEQAKGKIVRINDGHDSYFLSDEEINYLNNLYDDLFYNTSVPIKLKRYKRPVVLTLNPSKITDKNWHQLKKTIPKNLMFIRIRTNTWNLENVVKPAISYYAQKEVPIILTFMAYFTSKIPKEHEKNYIFRKRTLNSYNAITTKAWENIMNLFKYNKWVYSCGRIEGEKGDTHCRFCGNCLREYYATKERLRNG